MTAQGSFGVAIQTLIINMTKSTTDQTAMLAEAAESTNAADGALNSDQ